MFQAPPICLHFPSPPALQLHHALALLAPGPSSPDRGHRNTRQGAHAPRWVQYQDALSTPKTALSLSALTARSALHFLITTANVPHAQATGMTPDQSEGIVTFTVLKDTKTRTATLARRLRTASCKSIDTQLAWIVLHSHRICNRGLAHFRLCETRTPTSSTATFSLCFIFFHFYPHAKLNFGDRLPPEAQNRRRPSRWQQPWNTCRAFHLRTVHVKCMSSATSWQPAALQCGYTTFFCARAILFLTRIRSIGKSTS